MLCMLYMRLGTTLLTKLRGAFAFCVFDAKTVSCVRRIISHRRGLRWQFEWHTAHQLARPSLSGAGACGTRHARQHRASTGASRRWQPRYCLWALPARGMPQPHRDPSWSLQIRCVTPGLMVCGGDSRKRNSNSKEIAMAHVQTRVLMFAGWLSKPQQYAHTDEEIRSGADAAAAAAQRALMV